MQHADRRICILFLMAASLACVRAVFSAERAVRQVEVEHTMIGPENIIVLLRE